MHLSNASNASIFDFNGLRSSICIELHRVSYLFHLIKKNGRSDLIKLVCYLSLRNYRHIYQNQNFQENFRKIIDIGGK